MNRIFFGDLECTRVPYSKALRRHVEKRISEWITHRNFPEYPKGLSYRVSLEREGDGHTIGCAVEIKSRQETWIGHSWGRTPEDALAQTLARMSARTAALIQPRTVQALKAQFA